MDAYGVLGLTEKASDEDIARAYKRLAMEYHPDKNGGDDSKMMALNEAYALIRTPELRKKYGGGNDFTTRFKWMEAVFGKCDVAANFAKPPSDDRPGIPGSDIDLDLPVSMKDFIFGAGEREVGYSRTGECLECSGLGGERQVNCPRCGATGKLAFRGSRKICPKCAGKGKTVIGECQVCRGAGSVERETKVTVQVGAGVALVELPGKGNEGLRGGPNGNLRVHVVPEPDAERGIEAFLDRDGNPYVSITAWAHPEDFILGVTLDFDIYGHLLVIDVPPGSNGFCHAVEIGDLLSTGLRAVVNVVLAAEDDSMRECYVAMRKTRNMMKTGEKDIIS